MKKYLAILLALVLCISMLAACTHRTRWHYPQAH